MGTEHKNMSGITADPDPETNNENGDFFSADPKKENAPKIYDIMINRSR
jgi:hypothetical protein